MKNVETAATAAAEMDRLTEPAEIVAASRQWLHDGQGIEIGIVGSSGGFAVAIEVGDALIHGLPQELAAALSRTPAPDFEFTRLVDDRLNAQHEDIGAVLSLLDDPVVTTAAQPAAVAAIAALGYSPARRKGEGTVSEIRQRGDYAPRANRGPRKVPDSRKVARELRKALGEIDEIASDIDDAALELSPKDDDAACILWDWARRLGKAWDIMDRCASMVVAAVEHNRKFIRHASNMARDDKIAQLRDSGKSFGQIANLLKKDGKKMSYDAVRMAYHRRSHKLADQSASILDTNASIRS